MIKILSIAQAEELREVLPEIVLLRSHQFQGERYDPDIDGFILVLEPGEKLHYAVKT